MARNNILKKTLCLNTVYSTCIKATTKIIKRDFDLQNFLPSLEEKQKPPD